MAVQESQLQKDKIRVYVLARELNIDTKELLDLCKQAGLDVKNQLSSIDPDQKEMIEQLVKKGAHKAPAPAKAAGPSALPEVGKTIRNLSTSRPIRREAEPVHAAPSVTAAPPAASPPPVAASAPAASVPAAQTPAQAPIPTIGAPQPAVEAPAVTLPPVAAQAPVTPPV